MSISGDGDKGPTEGRTIRDVTSSASLGGKRITFFEAVLISAPPAVAAFLFFLARAPERVGSILVEFGADPIGFIRRTIVQIIFLEFIAPLAIAIFESFLAVVDLILIFFLGTNQAIGISPGGLPGLIELPLAVVNPILAFAFTVAGIVIGGIRTFNLFVAGLAAELGLAAPPVVTGLVVLEVVGVAWGAWILFQTVDVFTGGVLGEIVDVFMAVTRPFRNLIDLLIERF